MNDFLLARVNVIWADTPKSAVKRKRREKRREQGGENEGDVLKDRQ